MTSAGLRNGWSVLPREGRGRFSARRHGSFQAMDHSAGSNTPAAGPFQGIDWRAALNIRSIWC